MATYADFIALAQRLIALRGRTCSLVKMSAAAADPTKPWNGPGAPTELARADVIGCFVPKSGTDLGQGFISKEQLKRCQEVVLVAPGEEDYTAFGVLLDDAVRWKVEWVQVLKPGPVPVLYALGVSR